MFNFTIDKTPKKDLSNDKTYDLIVLGGGPAGLNAALYAKRKNLDVIIVANEIGGQLNNTADVDNYLGFKAVDASRLIEAFQSHVNTFGVPTLTGVYVKEIQKSDNLFAVSLSTGETLSSKTVIYTLGGNPRKLGVKGEKEFQSRGVSYCVTCDGPFFKNKVVAVIGGGNSAVDAAIDLAQIAKQVILIQRSQLRADQSSVLKLQSLPNVQIHLETDVLSFNGQDILKSLSLYDKHHQSTIELEVDGVFVEIGNIPNSDLASEFVLLNDQKEIITNELQETKTKGFYAAGDVTSMPHKQVIIAASQGAIAALQAAIYINKGE
jgi:thioredoxin-disulfide reductase